MLDGGEISALARAWSRPSFGRRLVATTRWSPIGHGAFKRPFFFSDAYIKNQMTAPSGLPNVSKEIFEKKMEHVAIIHWMGAYWTMDGEFDAELQLRGCMPASYAWIHQDAPFREYVMNRRQWM